MNRVRLLPLLCCLGAACGCTQGFQGGQDSAGKGSELRLRGDAIARQIEATLHGTQGEFNADQVVNGRRVPGSFIQLGPALGDRRFEFSVPDRVVDLSYAGKIYYRVDHIRLDQIHVRTADGQFVFDSTFRTGSVALKGSHSVLGDAAVPDIRLQNIHLQVRLVPVVLSTGKITYESPKVTFTADVDNTFLPRFELLDNTVDVMDAVTNYRWDLCRSIQTAIQSALDDPVRKAALAAKIQEGIAGELTGPKSPIASLRFEGTDLLVMLRRAKG